MRGVVLAGGCATDSWPTAPTASAPPKTLLAVHDQPMIYHPLSLLLLAGIRHILIIATPRDMPHFQRCLGGGARWGINLSYGLQPATGGPVRALIMASEFTGDRSVALALGDHIFYGKPLPATLRSAATLKKGARLLAHPGTQAHPSPGGVVSLDDRGNPV